jgi:hypothetical protein
VDSVVSLGGTMVRLDLAEYFFLLFELNANWQASFVTNNFFLAEREAFCR